MSAASKPARQMTVDEFLDWDSGDGRMWQLVDGRPEAMAPALLPHGLLQAEVARLIGNHLRSVGSPCDVFVNPVVIPAAMAAINMRVPDLVVSCSPVEAGQRAARDPVLIVEILSPSNKAETWANVQRFATIPSVREILVLHSEEIAADLMRRRPDGSRPDEPERIAGGELRLDSIGFAVRMAELYARMPAAG
jgi:Uma2 family endonuclease